MSGRKVACGADIFHCWSVCFNQQSWFSSIAFDHIQTSKVSKAFSAIPNKNNSFTLTINLNNGFIGTLLVHFEGHLFHKRWKVGKSAPNAYCSKRLKRCANQTSWNRKTCVKVTTLTLQQEEVCRPLDLTPGRGAVCGFGPWSGT